MIRVKIVEPNPKYDYGEVYELTNNEAFGLLDKGIAILTKDITYKETKVKNVRPGNIRPDLSSRR